MILKITPMILLKGSRCCNCFITSLHHFLRICWFHFKRKFERLIFSFFFTNNKRYLSHITKSDMINISNIFLFHLCYNELIINLKRKPISPPTVVSFDDRMKSKVLFYLLFIFPLQGANLFILRMHFCIKKLYCTKLHKLRIISLLWGMSNMNTILKS